MRLSEKVRALREKEGERRGLGRAMTQAEVIRALDEEQGRSLSQSYFSQIESGARPHLTNNSRLLLARFFRVHPGHLVDDPDDSELHGVGTLHMEEDRLDSWLAGGAQRFHGDAEICRALLAIAQYDDSRRALLLLGRLLESTGLAEQLERQLGQEAQQNMRTSEAMDTSGRQHAQQDFKGGQR